MFRDFLFRLPELKDNDWFSFQYRNFIEAEDEGERGPPLAMLFDEETEQKRGLSTRLSLNDLRDRPEFFIPEDKDGQ